MCNGAPNYHQCRQFWPFCDICRQHVPEPSYPQAKTGSLHFLKFFSVLVAVAALRASAVALCGGPSGFRCPPVFQLLFGFPCDGLKRCAILMAREIGNSAAPAGALFPVRAQPHRFPWASPQPPRQIGEGCCGLAGSWNSATASWQPVLY